MEARRKGNWLAAFCAALCLLTTFAAGAWAGDAAKFVSENYPDNSSVDGGKSFTKTWTIKNSGTKTWDSDWKLKYVNGDLSSSHSSIKISGKVKPGNNYTFSVDMKAPDAKSSDKTYQEDWKFVNSSGSTLTPLWVKIKVPAAAKDEASFVSKTYADNIDMSGGTSFTQKWEIKNTGTTTWNSGYKLKYMNGNLSNSQSSIAVSGTVKPGSSYTFSMSMKAPAAQSTVGNYREDWKFVNSSGSTLTTLWTQIVVPKAVVADDYGNDCNTAAAISLNSSKNGKIDFAGDNDYFSVQVSSKGTLTVETTGDTDTYGRLLDSSCKEIEHDDDEGKGDNFKISKKVSAGTYYVAVRHHSSTKTGSYALNVALSTNVAANPLDVPYLNQRSIPTIGDSACASASAAMILAYHGKVGKSQKDMRNAALDVWNATGSVVGQGVVLGNLVNTLKRKGFTRTESRTDGQSQLYDLIRTEIKAGRPVMLHATKNTMTSISGHYLVIIGYEGDDYRTGKVIVNDPYGEWNGSNKFSLINSKEEGSKKGAGVKYSFTAVTRQAGDGIILVRP
jgi:uncharacterized protein YvpB